MSWLFLLVAGLLEVAWAVGLKFIGLDRILVLAGTVAAMILSIGLLAMAVRTIPLGTAYAVWTGIGVVGTVFLGTICFGEPLTFTRIVCVGLVLVGILGLKLTSCP